MARCAYLEVIDHGFLNGTKCWCISDKHPKYGRGENTLNRNGAYLCNWTTDEGYLPKECKQDGKGCKFYK